MNSRLGNVVLVIFLKKLFQRTEDLPSLDHKHLLKINHTTSKERHQTSKKLQSVEKYDKV